VIAAASLIRIVDDDASFLTAVSRMLRGAGYTVRTFSSPKEVLDQLTDTPGCLIADLRMPGLSGLDLQDALTRSGNLIPVIFLTGQGDIPTSVQAMRHGAEDFLTKTAPKEELLAAIKRALAHDSSLRIARARKDKLQDRFRLLTARELEVLRHVMQGQLNKQIAADLEIAERTVKLHRTAITTKLHVGSVAELTRLVQEAGLFAPR
jgi:two-component system, LuxR family, response regulator FixJ